MDGEDGGGEGGRRHLRFGSGSLRGRKLFNGAYMSNISRRKSRTARRRVAAAVDVAAAGSCVKFLFFYYLI